MSNTLPFHVNVLLHLSDFNKLFIIFLFIKIKFDDTLESKVQVTGHKCNKSQK